MALRDWIGDSMGGATLTVATTATFGTETSGSVATVATVSVANIEKVELLDRGADARRGKVLARLNADANLNRVFDVNSNSETDYVIVTVAIRNIGACEYAIPREKFDSWKFLQLFEKHGGERVH